MSKIISPIPAIAKKAAVPADMLSREEIERFLAFRGDYLELRREHVRELAQRALSEPTRLASARQEGYREGAEAAAQLCDHEGTHWHSAGDADLTEYGKGAKTAARGLAKSIRTLSPPPAEPSAPVAPEDDALVDRFAAALKEKMAIARAKGRSGWQASDWERVCRADLAAHLAKGDVRDCALYLAFMWHHGWKPVTDEFASLVEQVKAQAAALEAENTKLREGLKDTTAHLVAAHSLLSRTPRAKKAAPSNTMFDMMLRDYETSCERASAILRGGPDAG